MTLIPPSSNDRRKRAPRWRRRLRPIAWGALLVVGIWYIATQILPWVRQFRCSRYALPPGTVVFDTDPATSAPLLSSSAYAVVDSRIDPPRPAPVGRISPSLNSQPTVGAVFIHLRRTLSDDSERLVFVAASDYAQTPDGYAAVGIYTRSFIPRSLLPGSTPRRRAGAAYLFRMTPGQRLKLFAGQADPRDSTRFTFDYELDGLHGTIGGWLRDDTDKGIILRVHDGGADLEDAGVLGDPDETP